MKHAVAFLFAVLVCKTALAGDATKGEQVFEQCSSCHSIEPGETTQMGPNLRGIIGRRAGTLPGFEYSPAMIEAGRARGIVWTESTLDTYLADPEAMVPGTMMGGVRLDDASERADLIAYLKTIAK